MTNTIALWLGIVLIGLFVADFMLFDADYTMSLARRLIGLIDWLAFWR